MNKSHVILVLRMVCTKYGISSLYIVLVYTMVPGPGYIEVQCFLVPVMLAYIIGYRESMAF